LSTTTTLPKDATCKHGGVRVDTGLDNGAGGGVANDATLQDGEVTSSTVSCYPAPQGCASTEGAWWPAVALAVVMCLRRSLRTDRLER
jgi:hypothetical protein